MILKKLEVRGFRPFYVPTEIEFDPDITILTGANDVGKSSIIRLLDIIANKRKIEEEDANLDTLVETSQEWSNNGSVRCVALFEINDASTNFIASKNVQSGYTINVDFVLSSGKSVIQKMWNLNGEEVALENPSVGKLPNVILLPSHQTVGSVIDPQELNDLERRLVEAGFGKNAFIKTSALKPAGQIRQLEQAEEKLNNLFEPYMPQGSGLRLRLRFTSPDVPQTNKLVVSLRDRNGGHTALGLRGAGIRKLLTIFAELVSVDTVNQFTWILFDEPENSLHADAQHLLRSILEKIGRQNKIQVIYATHSSAMINNIFPERIRLLERVNQSGFATTKVIKNATLNNFQAVRSHLGMTPADSLLYTPVTVIVEGKTEAYNLGEIFTRLGRERYDEFPYMGTIVSQIHFLDGGGSQFIKWIPMAKKQGATPIVLVDGDKIQEVEKAKNEHNIECVSFDKGKEFEDIVPRSKYFEALMNITGNKALSEKAFDSWQSSSNINKDLVITLRISKWLDSQSSTVMYDKEAVMRNALKITDLEDMDIAKIEQLIGAIKKALAL